MIMILMMMKVKRMVEIIIRTAHITEKAFKEQDEEGEMRSTSSITSVDVKSHTWVQKQILDNNNYDLKGWILLND